MKTYEELIDIMIEDDKHEKQLLERHYEETCGDKLPTQVNKETKLKLDIIMNGIMRYYHRIEALRELKYMYYHQEEYEFEERV